MVISFRRNFVFIHIPKCGGESLTHLLLAAANGGVQVADKHAGYQTLVPLLGDEISRFTVFAVVRNPFDQVVSFYEHLRKPLSMSQKGIEAQYPGSGGRISPRWACELACSVEFSEFVSQVYGAQPPGLARSREYWFRDLASWLVRSDGSLAVNRLLRLETLAADFARLKEDLGLTGALSHLNASRHEASPDDYRGRYDEPTRNLIAARFRTSLELFGYRF